MPVTDTGPSRSLAALGLPFIAALVLAGPALGDLKLVSAVTVSAPERPAATRTVVTYYKGDMVRTETDRTISLYDASKQTVTTLNKGQNTYRVLSLKSAFTQSAGILGRVRFSATASMDRKDETRLIAGRMARRYAGKAQFAMSVDGLTAKASPQTTIEIEQWATEGLSLPSSSRGVENPLLRMAGPLQTMRGMEPLARALAKVKGTTLSNRITVLANGPDGTPKPPVVTSTEVASISEAPLSPSLFRIPAGYRRVDTSPIPSMPNGLRSAASR